ncbi:unnamed protein product [Choristocarpus tenellus]
MVSEKAQPGDVQRSYRDAISKAATRQQKEVVRVKHILDQKWASYKEDLQDLQSRKDNAMVLHIECTAKYEMMILNVGGSIFNLRRSILSSVEGSILQEIFGGRWDARLRRDSDNSIFLDVSPSTFKGVVRLLEGERAYSWNTDKEDRSKRSDGVFEHLVHSLGLEKILLASVVDFIGGSSVLGKQRECDGSIRSWLREHLPSSTTGRLKLLYRASRDGFNACSFHERCDDVECTVVLVRCGEGVVGGYTDQSWSGKGGKQSKKAFVFSLLDYEGNFNPGRRIVEGGNGTHCSTYCDPKLGPDFCGPFLGTYFHEGNVVKGGKDKDRYRGDEIVENIIEKMIDQAFTDLEVFEVESKHTPHMDPPSSRNLLDLPFNCESLIMSPAIENIFQQEKVALANAKLELMRANEALRFGEDSLANIFGLTQTTFVPMENGEKTLAVAETMENDEIVHLNVRGHTMSTMRSTLVLCKNSVLADYNGENGFHFMDYSPSAFATILDVLRIRAADKRKVCVESDTPKTGMERKYCVRVKEKEREGFIEVVDSLFPDCQNVIFDGVIYE